MDYKGFRIGGGLALQGDLQKRAGFGKADRRWSRKVVTVIEVIFGDGRVLPPVMINKRQTHNMGWYEKLKKKRLS